MLHLPHLAFTAQHPLPILGVGEAPAVHSPTSLRLGWKECVGVLPPPTTISLPVLQASQPLLAQSEN